MDRPLSPPSRPASRSSSRTPSLPFLLLLLLPGLLFVSIATAQDLEISSFDVEIEVAPDNSYHIRETIEVEFYNRSLHGIFRKIPSRTYFGKPVHIGEIEVPGREYQQSSEGGMVNLRIGDPAATVSPREVYTISYSYPLGDDHNREMDEFYWNIVGTEWEVPIRMVNFRIEMPEAFDREALSFTCGYAGSTVDANCPVEFQVRGNTISGVLEMPLSPYQGLTLALPLPEGYYSEVQPEGRLIYAILPFLPFLYGAVLVLAILIYILFGRGKPLIPAVQFYPPEGFNPAEAGYIHDGRVDPYDITALFVYWADRGLLSIIEEEEKGGLFKNKRIRKISFRKERKLPDNAPEHERLLFNGLFRHADSEGLVELGTLKDKIYIDINNAKHSIEASFTKDKGRRLFLRRSLVQLLLFFLGFGALLSAGLATIYRTYPFAGWWMLLWFPVPVIAVGPVTGAARFLRGFSTYHLADRIGKLIFFMLGVGIFLALLVGLYLLVREEVVMLYSGLAAAVVCYFLVTLSERRTEQGHRWTEAVMGFKQFIARTEKDRIIRMVEEDPSYFYHILPYAMVFGVTDKWARTFQDLVISPPEWYRGPYSSRDGFETYLFYTGLNQTMDQVRNSVAPPASASSSGGSSGGGSAGGGSGGGGGGGW